MIKVENLCLNIGTFSLRNVSLRVASDDYFVLLGPTGSGKTVFLKCLCGLVRAKGGSIRIDGRDVTDLAPRLRQIGYVPQDYGLFPHLSVLANITFALRARWIPRRRASQQVAPLVEMLQLGPLIERSPANLSGGERQRVALARALAIRPRLLLLDEPVSALDEPTRERVCSELRRVQKELKVTTVHVSHNVEEALAVSDRAAIMREGELIQTGPMMELLRRPKSEAVAAFLRAENIFTGEARPASDGHSIVAFSGHTIQIPHRCEGNMKFVIRPEALRVSAQGESSGNSVHAVLARVTDRGPYSRLEFEAGIRLVVYVTADGAFEEFVLGREYTVTFPPDAVHVLAQDSKGKQPTDGKPV